MSRVSIAERTTLLLFVLRRGLRSALHRFNAHPFVRWRFSPRTTDRLVIAPQDLRTADATRASEIYAGRFAFAGKIVVCDGRSPFDMDQPSDEWAEMLFGFGWLRHLRAAESSITRSNARALVDEWIALQGGRSGIAWRPDVVARRVISWLSHAPLLVQDADARFYRRFLRSLARHAALLRRIGRDPTGGIRQVQIAIALTLVALCMAGQARLLRGATKRLVDELQRQVLPDGGHISRKPGAVLELLVDLLPLRQAYAARNVPPPPALLNAIDRMMPMLRFFRHGDGSFALFNGMGPTSPELVATILAYDDARGEPVENAPHSGYQRLQNGPTVVVIDTGAPPPVALSHEAHAGCLSFEFSVGSNRVVVNCGMPATNRDSWRAHARETSAHSTATIAETSSCTFGGATLSRFVGAPIVSGPRRIIVDREDDPGSGRLRASHDGYADQFGIVHERTLALSPEGDRLEGEDAFRPARGQGLPKRGQDEFALRFHLHPSVRASRVQDGRGVMLVLANREVWTFSAGGEDVALEESVYMAGRDGPRRTQQIVVRGHARQTPRIEWSFAQAPVEGSERRRVGAEEPQLPL